MSAAQDYYNQVLGMGHSPENALAYTRQHYPDFVPGVAAPVAAPVVAPVSQQAVPAVQPVAQPAVAAAPVAAAPMAAAPAVGAPMGAQAAYAPMATTPLPAGGTTPMMWGAVGCIVFALMLSIDSDSPTSSVDVPPVSGWTKICMRPCCSAGASS